MNMEIHVFGKEDSVKETHQGFLSRSIPARRRRSLRGRLRTKKGRHADACLPFLCHVNTIAQLPILEHKPAIQRSDCGFERRKTFAVEAGAPCASA